MRPALQFILQRVETLRVAAQADGEATRKLSRIHFHYLRYHAIVADLSEELWRGSDVAVASGAWAAAGTACDLRGVSDSSNAREFDPSDVELDDFTKSLLERDLDTGHLKAVRHGEVSTDLTRFETFLAPVLVCKHPRKTVGLVRKIHIFVTI